MTFDVKIPVQAKDQAEASSVQKSLLLISHQFTPKQLETIARKLQNPIIKGAVIQKLI